MTAPPLLQAARELLDYLETLGRPACLIGGMVVARWGEPRATRDVDATVLVASGDEARLLAEGVEWCSDRPELRGVPV